MNQEYAEQLDEDTEVLLERWNGAPEQFAEDVFRFRDKGDGQLKSLELFYPYQPKLLHAYFYGDEKIINVYKGRRIGVSFIFALAILIEALSIPDSNYAIVSRTKGQAEERISDIKKLLRHSKLGFADLDNDLKKNNKGYIVLPNDAEVRAFSGDPNAARGFDSAKTVFVDEQAFLDDQEGTMQAFMPFINLVPGSRMLQVSTPRVSNDLFMDTHARGSETGEDGVISVKQPSFANAEDIDPERSLFDQHVEPVRPDFDLHAVEAERAQDPEGFAQEYLCRPISDEYRFFTSDGVKRAQRRGAAVPENFNPDTGVGGGKATSSPAYWHPATHARCGGTMVMGVDIGIDRDDTAIAVFEHINQHRYLRFHTVLDRQDLMALGCKDTNTKNPSTVAQYIYRLSENMGVKHVFLDKTGPGRGFQEEVETRLGKRSIGFNFSDKDEIERMMGDFNYALHNDLITLVPGKTINDQLMSIVKEKNKETSKPDFSGKKHAADGKDDLAWALVLGAYPPNFNADRSHKPHQRDEAYGSADPDETVPGEGEYRGAKTTQSRGEGGDRLQRSSRHSVGVRVTGSRGGRTASNYTARHNTRKRSRR